MSFLTETDNKKYATEKKRMKKQKKVFLNIDEHVTSEGTINLKVEDVDQIIAEMYPRYTRSAT